ncbi:MAG: ParB-like protein partition protein [Candidatus Nomurabacteria bacterium]|nr:ParB-like protein partition protein [Candidatus Nomurabacteria bacterium]
MSNLYSNSIFFIEVDKIVPNPYQPRREFDPGPLKDLADSIRQYGILQPLTVSRVERETAEGGLVTEYELIAGERRLRASKLAGLTEVPAIIRVGDDSMMKLELAIIENLQREDLNAVERARAFARLVEEFKFTHTQIGQKMGKSREYVSNTVRLLSLPQEMLDALSMGKINEGHTRPLLMLSSRPEEQATLFKEIQFRKITVREAERIARRIATDKVRKHSLIPNAELMQIEQQLQESLGTRVHIEPKEAGGKITIDYFSNDDLDLILNVLKNREPGVSAVPQDVAPIAIEVTEVADVVRAPDGEIVFESSPESERESIQSLDDRDAQETSKSEEEVDDLYNLKNFSL